MAELLNAFSAMFVIFLIFSVGYLLGHLGWLTAADKRFVNKYVVNIAVPINCVVGVLNNFTQEDLLHAGRQFLVGIIVVALSLLLSAGAATALKLPRERWGVFVAMGGISNTMFIGLPVTQQLFGPVSLPYLMIYFLSSTLYTQTVSVILCEHAGGAEISGRGKLHLMLLDILKKPPVLGILTAVALLLLDLRPPEVIMSAAGYISSTVTPLALIYCGFILYEVGLRNLGFLPGLPAMLLIRLVAAPALCIAMCRLLGITGLPRDVFVVLSGLPVVSQVTVMAGAYGADERYAAIGSCLSTLGSFFSVPILMLLLG